MKNYLRIITIIVAAGLVYLVNIQFEILTAPNTPLIVQRGVGIFITVVSLAYLVMELRSNLPFFYGRSQRGGSNANGSVVAGLGIGILSTSWMELIILTAIIVAIYIILLNFLSHRPTE